MLLAKIGGWLRIPELRPSSTDWQKIHYSRCICAPALSGNASKTNGKRGISLGEVAARATHIEVACSGCDRPGGYLLARLVARLGEDFPTTHPSSKSANCPRRNAFMTERCDVYFLGFTKIMLGSEPTEKALHEDSDEYDDY
jgi:hypothetical protein